MGFLAFCYNMDIDRLTFCIISCLLDAVVSLVFGFFPESATANIIDTADIGGYNNGTYPIAIHYHI